MNRETAEAVCAAIAERLASPDDARQFGLPQGWHPQSLAYGATGIALLHIERAHSGLGSWQRVHDWLACVAAGQVVSGEGSHLHFGAPALAFVLNAAADQPGRYARPLEDLDRHVTSSTRHRLERAHRRMDGGRELPVLEEFDGIRGLSGVGTYLLRRRPHEELLRGVLTCLVRLTEPVKRDGELLPGWWSDLAPSGRPSPDYPGGHSNNGMAHGIAGPLALLALAARQGITVDGHREAIGRICTWFDRWRQNGETGHWWPHLVTRAQLRGEQQFAAAAPRPSWCYGTAGHARSLQLAALATVDATLRHMAEDALARALTDPAQLAATTDRSLCHGYAGLAHIAAAAADDALTPDIGRCVPQLLDAIGTSPDHALAESLTTSDIGLLEGAAGVALALHTAATGTVPVSGWDAFLLIN